MRRVISLLLVCFLLLALTACGQKDAAETSVSMEAPASSAETGETAGRMTVELTPEQEQARQAAMDLTFTAVDDGNYFMALRSDGRVIALPSYSEEHYLSEFKAQLRQGMYDGWDEELALQSYRQNLRHAEAACQAFNWGNIVQTASNLDAVFGLDDQGRVHASGQTWRHEDVRDWSEITAIDSRINLLVGLRQDGTVAVSGENFYKYSSTQNWSGIQSVYTNGNTCMGVTESGGILLAGDLAGNVNIDPLKDAQSFALGTAHILGLRPDGTVAAAPYANLDKAKLNAGQCNVEGWTDIVAVDAGQLTSVGLRSDGTVVACGRYDAAFMAQIAELRDVASISVSVSETGETICGLKNDGSFFCLAQDGTGEDSQKAMDWLDVYAVSAGERHILGLKTDGTVVAMGDNDVGQCDVDQWDSLVQVAAGNDFSLGLRSDGTVTATGSNELGQCMTENWEGVVKIGAGQFGVGLTAEGEVLNAGWANVRLEDFSQKEIVAVAAGNGCSYGICEDGSVAFAGNQVYTYSADWKWSDVVKLEPEKCGFALKSDGTVAVPPVEYLDIDLSQLTDLKDFSATSYGILGLKNDGTVVTLWGLEKNSPFETYDVSGWQDVVRVEMQAQYALGLRADGTVAAAGDEINGVHHAAEWTDIVDIALDFINAYGLKSDGTVVAAGHHMQMYNVPSQSHSFLDQLFTWTDIVDLECSNLGLFGLKSDGTVCYLPDDSEIVVSEVEDWTDIVQISASYDHVLGLKKDGTVVAAGSNDYFQCEINGM